MQLRFFFYGTLGEGMDNPTILAIRPKLGRPRPATVRGVLYALPDRDGWYPGLVPDAAAAPVGGVLYEPGAAFTEADVARLDAYEAYDPADESASEYVRREIEATTADGERVSAQVYIYRGALPSTARRIEEGSFPAFLAAHGLKPLAPRDP